MAVFYWEESEGVYDFLTLDATVSETHKSENKTTEHPVEKGANVADHVIEYPWGFTVEGVLSQTPAEQWAWVTNPRDRAKRMMAQLLSIKTNKTPVNALTSLFDYENVQLTSIEVPRDAQYGDSIYVRLSFKQIVQVITKTAKAPDPKQKRAEQKKSGGKTATKTSSAGEQSFSHALVVG